MQSGDAQGRGGRAEGKGGTPGARDVRTGPFSPPGPRARSRGVPSPRARGPGCRAWPGLGGEGVRGRGGLPSVWGSELTSHLCPGPRWWGAVQMGARGAPPLVLGAASSALYVPWSFGGVLRGG